MSQNALAPINPSTTSGSDLATKLVNNENSVLTQHSGSGRPSYAQSGTLWLDTTANPWLWKVYNGSVDIAVAAFSTGGSGRHREAVNEESLSGATPNVLGSTSKFIQITGNTTITSLGSEPNQIKFVRFASNPAPQLTHNATTLILPFGGANIAGNQNDTFIVASDSAGNARVYGYQRATGSALSAPVAEFAGGGAVSLVFWQAAAPTGWTKQVTHDDKAMRVVSGTGGGSAGSLNFSTVHGLTATNSHTLTSADIPSHTHGPGSYSTSFDGGHGHSMNNATNVCRSPNTSSNSQSGGGANIVNTVSQSTLSVDSVGDHGHDVDSGVSGSYGSSGGHSHGIDLRVRYLDVIICSKN